MISKAEEAENCCIEKVGIEQIKSSKLSAYNEHVKICYIQCSILLTCNTIILVIVLIVDIATVDRSLSAELLIAFVIGLGTQAALALWTIALVCWIAKIYSKKLHRLDNSHMAGAIEVRHNIRIKK